MSHRRELLICGVSLFTILSAAVVFGGKNADPEALAYIPDFLRELPLLRRVFDIDKNDYNIFRARELSYLFNIFDANLLLTSYKLGLIRFCSFVHLFTVFVAGMVQLRFTQIYFPQTSFLIRLLPVLLFATCPAVFVGCGFFRTSKVLVALGVTGLCWATYGTFFGEKGGKLSATQQLGLVSFAFAVSLSDEQGLFLILALSGLAIVALGFRRSVMRVQATGCLLFSAMLHFVYRYWLGVLLTKRFYGALPDPAQKVKPVLADLTSFSLYLDEAAIFLFDTVRFFVGTHWIVGAAFLALAFWHYRKGNASVEGMVIFYTTLSVVFVMTTLMIGRHPPITEIDVRRVYYALPLSALILFGAGVLFGLLSVEETRWERRLTFALALVFFLNLRALPGHQRIMDSNLFRFYKHQSDEVTACLKTQGPYETVITVEEDRRGQVYCDLFKRLAGKQ